jgi:hypothetical protein
MKRLYGVLKEGAWGQSVRGQKDKVKDDNRMGLWDISVGCNGGRERLIGGL